MNEQSSAFTLLSAAHQRYFFSGQRSSSDDLLAWMSTFGAEVVKEVPRWRRVLGALNPFTPFLSR